MILEIRDRIYAELESLVLIDPHTHIDPHQPASKTLADILGYHYYTELAHSAGMAKSQIEEPRLPPKEKVARLMANLGPIENTIQYSWFVEMAQKLFDFVGDSIRADNWESLYDLAEKKMASPDWADEVLKKSNLEAVFLTNDFDDPLSGFDTDRYIPCLRTDDLVFNLAKVDVVERLERATGTNVTDAASLRDAIACLFTHFKANGARACAISLPPDFTPTRVSPGRAQTAVDSLLRRGLGAGESDRRAAANFVFWTLAEYCAEFKMPFDLMIGVNRGVYEGGVHQGRDLYDSRCSLIQYKALFNAFPRVVFPVSVLTSVMNQELASYAWIFPNVVTNGHWWYSNTPTFIEHDLACRMEAVPRTKQIGYYSDMYKLEFALPKFNMYKRILSKVLAERYVIDRGWSETRAVDFAKQMLRGNVEALFGFQGEPWTPSVDGHQAEPDWSAPIPVKPWGQTVDPTHRHSGGEPVRESLLQGSSLDGGWGSNALGTAGVLGAAGATLAGMAAISAFRPAEASPLPEDHLDLQESSGELSDEQMIDFDAAESETGLGSAIGLEPASDLQDISAEEIEEFDEASLVEEQPFVAEAPHATDKPFIEEPASDIPMEFSFDSGDLTEENAKGQLDAAGEELEHVAEDTMEAAMPPKVSFGDVAHQFGLEPTEHAETAEEADMFSEIELASEAEPPAAEELTPLGVEELEPRVEFSSPPPPPAEIADDSDMFFGVEDMKEVEHHAGEALAPLGMESLEPEAPLSLEPAVEKVDAEEVEETDDSAMFAEFREAGKAESAVEELDDIELEELDMEEVESPEEVVETLEDELHFEDFNEEIDKEKKSEKKPRTGANPNDDSSS